MILTTNEVRERYKIPHSTFSLKKQKIIDAGGLHAKGKGGSDPWLWKSSVVHQLALDGTLGNKARQAAHNQTWRTA